MENKVLINVELPAKGETYDFWVPANMTIQAASDLVADAMQVIEPDFYKNNGDAALMYLPTGQIQQPHATIAEIGCTNGDRFVLI